MEYIHHYTLMTGHMRKSYSNEVEKEIRIREESLLNSKEVFHVITQFHSWTKQNCTLWPMDPFILQQS